MNDKAFLADVNKSLDNMGIRENADILKAESGVISTLTTNFDALLPAYVVDALIAYGYPQSSWLSSVNRVTKQHRLGTVPIMELNGNVTEGVGENEAPTNIKRPETRHIHYACKSFAATWHATVDELKEAAAAGMTDFETRFLELFGIAIGNDKANIVMNGNTSLNDSTSLNRMLRMVNGVGVKAEGGNVLDAAGGPLAIRTTVSALDHFAAMEDALPEIYSSDPGLRWLYNQRVDSHYRWLLTNRIGALGDANMVSREIGRPQGIAPLIVPQISRYQGPTAIAPTSATSKTTYVEFVLTTLVTAVHVATAALGVGRRFRVTNLTTGLSEVCVGYLDTTLRIITTGVLGQTTISTTASDYTVGLCDETDIYHLNPAGITIVDCYEVEAYRTFEPKFRRWEFLTYFFMDVLIPQPAAIVKLKRVAVTPISVV